MSVLIKKWDVLGMGELVVQFVCEGNFNTWNDSKILKMYQSGSVANICANLQWLGNTTLLISTVGNDKLGKFIVQELDDKGLCSEFVKMSKTSATSIIITKNRDISSDLIAYRFADTEIKEVKDKLIEDSSIVHTSAFALSKDPARTSILNALEKACRMGKDISVDWNYIPSLWKGEDSQKVFNKIVELKPLLNITLKDAKLFAGKKIEIEGLKIFLSSFKTTLTSLLCDNGVWFCTEDNAEWKFIPVAKAKTVIDDDRLEDIYWAGFLNAYLKDNSIENCVIEGLALMTKKMQTPSTLYA
jgi:fructokinase